MNSVRASGSSMFFELWALTEDKGTHEEGWRVHAYLIQKTKGKGEDWCCSQGSQGAEAPQEFGESTILEGQGEVAEPYQKWKEEISGKEIVTTILNALRQMN